MDIYTQETTNAKALYIEHVVKALNTEFGYIYTQETTKTKALYIEHIVKALNTE